MVERTYKTGEIRRIEFAARSSVQNDVITITNAAWSITSLSTGTDVQRGECTVNGTRITALVPMETSGVFTLDVTADIPPETIIGRLVYEVVE